MLPLEAPWSVLHGTSAAPDTWDADAICGGYVACTAPMSRRGATKASMPFVSTTGIRSTTRRTPVLTHTTAIWKPTGITVEVSNCQLYRGIHYSAIQMLIKVVPSFPTRQFKAFTS